jgi:hypothetical protein
MDTGLRRYDEYSFFTLGHGLHRRDWRLAPTGVHRHNAIPRMLESARPIF